MPSGRDIGAEVRWKIQKYAMLGLTPKQIAERLGISETAARRWMPAPYKQLPQNESTK